MIKLGIEKPEKTLKNLINNVFVMVWLVLRTSINIGNKMMREKESDKEKLNWKFYSQRNNLDMESGIDHPPLLRES